MTSKGKMEGGAVAGPLRAYLCFLARASWTSSSSKVASWINTVAPRPASTNDLHGCVSPLYTTFHPLHQQWTLETPCLSHFLLPIAGTIAGRLPAPGPPFTAYCLHAPCMFDNASSCHWTMIHLHRLETKPCLFQIPA